MTIAEQKEFDTWYADLPAVQRSVVDELIRNQANIERHHGFVGNRLHHVGAGHFIEHNETPLTVPDLCPDAPVVRTNMRVDTPLTVPSIDDPRFAPVAAGSEVPSQNRGSSLKTRYAASAGACGGESPLVMPAL